LLISHGKSRRNGRRKKVEKNGMRFVGDEISPILIIFSGTYRYRYSKNRESGFGVQEKNLSWRDID
jgi:hypothetical protein